MVCFPEKYYTPCWPVWKEPPKGSVKLLSEVIAFRSRLPYKCLERNALLIIAMTDSMLVHQGLLRSKKLFKYYIITITYYLLQIGMIFATCTVFTYFGLVECIADWYCRGSLLRRRTGHRRSWAKSQLLNWQSVIHVQDVSTRRSFLTGTTKLNWHDWENLLLK